MTDHARKNILSKNPNQMQKINPLVDAGGTAAQPVVSPISQINSRNVR